MSIQDERHPILPGDTMAESRETVLASAQPFPRYEDMVIDGRTDDVEALFLAAIADA